MSGYLEEIEELKNEVETEILNIEEIFLKQYLDELGKDPLYFVNTVLEDETLKNEYLFKIRAYIILVHATFENYLELIARHYVLDSRERWEKNCKVNPTLTWLLLKMNETTRKSTNKKNDITAIVRVTTEKYFEKLGENHGIKESNLINMFGDLGLYDDIKDSELIKECNYFGDQRGVLAHYNLKTSISKHADGIRGITNVMDIKNKVLVITQEIENTIIKNLEKNI